MWNGRKKGNFISCVQFSGCDKPTYHQMSHTHVHTHVTDITHRMLYSGRNIIISHTARLLVKYYSLFVLFQYPPIYVNTTKQIPQIVH